VAKATAQTRNLFTYLFIYLLLGRQTYSYTNSNIQYTVYSCTEILKKETQNTMQITSPQTWQMHSKSDSLIELFENLTHYTNYAQRQKPDVCDEIATVEQQLREILLFPAEQFALV